jgi:hypothetical protein
MVRLSSHEEVAVCSPCLDWLRSDRSPVGGPAVVADASGDPDRWPPSRGSELAVEELGLDA